MRNNKCSSLDEIFYNSKNEICQNKTILSIFYFTNAHSSEMLFFRGNSVSFRSN